MVYTFLLFICLYLPFQLALNPAAGVDLASIRILILILFFVWLAEGLRKRNLKINNNLQAWMVGTFLFLNAFSAVVARNPEWSLRKLLFLFSIFPIYFVARQVLAKREEAIRVIKLLVSGGRVISLIGIFQFLGQFMFGLEAVRDLWAEFVIVPFLGNSFGEAVLKNPSWLVNIGGKTYLRATSLFPDPHMFSFYLGLLLPLSIGLLFREKTGKMWLGLSFGAIFLADLLTFSRGGYLGVVAGLFFVVMLFWRKIEKKHKIIMGILVMAGIIIMLVPSLVSQRLFSSFDLKEGSNQGRLAMWRKAAEVIVDKPFLGTGIGNYPLEVLPTATYRDPIYAHNSYLDVAVETGVANMLVFMGILSVTFIGFWRKSRKEKLFLFGATSLVIFATHSLVETAIYSPVVLTLFLIIISLNNIELKDEKAV